MEPPKKEDKTSVFANALAAITTLGSGVYVYADRVNSYAHEQLAKTGLLKDLESGLVNKLKAASDDDLIHAITASGTDGEGGWRNGGLFRTLEEDYRAGVKAIFKKEGAASLGEKWEKFLTHEQKNKTMQYTALTSAGVGALMYLAYHAQSATEPEPKIPHDPNAPKYADRIVQQRQGEPSQTAKIS
jgi:hypothetical protein